MEEISIARAVHLLGVVLWIGGVGFVTTVLLPSVQRLKSPEERVAFFEAIEGRFAWQARATTLVTGLSGLYLVIAGDMWHRFLDLEYLWMHSMVLVWALFSLMLFVAEPLFLHRWFQTRAAQNPEATFRLIRNLHRLLLTVSLATVLAAGIGAHGGI